MGRGGERSRRIDEHTEIERVIVVNAVQKMMKWKATNGRR